MRGWQNVVRFAESEFTGGIKREFFSSAIPEEEFSDPVDAGLPEFLERIFQCAGQPLELEEVVTLVFTISGGVEQKRRIGNRANGYSGFSGHCGSKDKHIDEIGKPKLLEIDMAGNSTIAAASTSRAFIAFER